MSIRNKSRVADHLENRRPSGQGPAGFGRQRFLFTRLPAIFCLLVAVLFFSENPAWTAPDKSFVLSRSNEVFGAPETASIADDEQTLIDLGSAHDLGYNEMVDANPGIDPWYPKKETKVIIPSSWILPELEESLSNAPGPYHTVQLGSYWRPEGAWEIYQSFAGKIREEDRSFLRLEKLDPYYTIRTGLFADAAEARKYFKRIKKLFPGALLASTHIRKDRVLYPVHLPPLPALGKKAEYPSCIIVNLAEFRLFRLTWKKEGIAVRTFPIGVGKQGTETIRGRFTVMEKLVDPVWIIPKSLKDEFPQYEKAIPPGPENPLGKHALRLSTPDYLIHGTNKPLGIGRRVSHGCIRMNPKDIETLHAIAKEGEEVVILYQPVKVGEKGGEPYVEVHEDYLNSENSAQMAISLLQKKDLLKKADLSLMFQALKEKRGVPVSLQSK